MATGEGVFRVGKDLSVNLDLTDSDESEHKSGDKTPVTDGEDDDENVHVGVFDYHLNSH